MLRRIELMSISVMVLALPFLSGCTSDTAYAPVVNAWHTSAAKSGTYRVRPGDTLYSVAWAFGLDYRALAAANNLRPPYEIRPGQRLRMTTVAAKAGTPSSAPTSRYAAKPGTPARRQPAKRQQPRRIVRSYKNYPAAPVGRWLWPARGKVVQGFSSSLAGNKGIDIAGRYGEPVRASASGVVVYAGDGVRSYGNLIIVKHNASYLSAYAYNSRMLVKTGMRVKAGQKIAQMGRTNAGRAQLHFEIRRNGQPVNPMRFLR